MANIRSSKKDIRRSARKRAINQSVRTALKTFIKKARALAGSEDATKSVEATRLAIKGLDKASQRGIIHKKQAARRKSRLMKAVNSVQSK